ncbi:hypothetical protein [Marinobacterium litorale]|uniref:hypothetical protein n=1 Tax=Marinobacterium litorale TaxID=404770 RepID=UPI0003F6EA51|nr:hypothetical protein [Marinobacterium litorale]
MAIDYAAQADKLIDVYLAWLLSSDTDAGWHQPSMLQRMVEFGGDIPPPTGNDQADLKMIQEMRFLREPHALLPEAREMIGQVKTKYRIPLLVHCRYTGTVDARTGRRWTARKLAMELHLSVDQYRDRVKMGRRKLVRFVEQYGERNERRAA